LRYKDRQIEADTKAFLLLREKIDSTMNYFANKNLYEYIEQARAKVVIDFIE